MTNKVQSRFEVVYSALHDLKMNCITQRDVIDRDLILDCLEVGENEFDKMAPIFNQLTVISTMISADIQPEILEKMVDTTINLIEHL